MHWDRAFARAFGQPIERLEAEVLSYLRLR